MVEKNNVHNRINIQLAIRIILISLLVTLFVSAYQLYSEYLVHRDRIFNSQQDVVKSYRESLEKNLRIMDQHLIKTHIKWIYSLSDISYISVVAANGTSWKKGDKKSIYVVQKTIDLTYQHVEGHIVELGTLIIQSDLSNVYAVLKNKAIVIMLIDGIKTFIVCGFILFFLRRDFTKPLENIANHLTTIKLNEPFQALSLKANKNLEGNEIDVVVDAINQMTLETSTMYNFIFESNEELESVLEEKNRLLEIETQFKRKLETNVQERTNELEDTFKELAQTQSVLEEKEKMAALGNLVASLCHEINTPLGISVTVTSSLKSLYTPIETGLANGSLKKAEFDKFLNSIKEVESLLDLNLKRASSLIRNFKQVSVDQTSSERREFDLIEMLNETIKVVTPLFKHQHVLSLSCSNNDIKMDSYPGPLGQVIINFVSNAIEHAYDKDTQGKMKIIVEYYKKKEKVSIIYSDDGIGVSEAHRKKIFNPFYTTNRELGGSGLGLSISYNIVTGILGGDLSVHSTLGKGTNFVIDIPCVAPIINTPE